MENEIMIYPKRFYGGEGRRRIITSYELRSEENPGFLLSQE